VKRKRFGTTATNPDPDTQAFLRDVRNKQNGGGHFVNLALDCQGYNQCDVAPIKFTKPEDIVQMINVYIRTLRTPSGANRRFSKRNALRLLAHLVGDLHQPLHVGTGFINNEGTTIKIERDPTLIKRKNFESDIGANKQLIFRADSGNMHSP
jgi:S1/P1 Nuclease.